MNICVLIIMVVNYYILNDFFKVIFYEKDKLRKLKYMFKGITDFMKNKMGELDDGK